MEREGQRAGEGNKQHDAVAIGIIPDFVIESVVEDEALALGPMAEIVANADAAFFARLWDEQGEMQAEDAVVSAAMGRDMLVGREDGKKRGLHPGDFAQQLHGLRATM